MANHVRRPVVLTFNLVAVSVLMGLTIGGILVIALLSFVPGPARESRFPDPLPTSKVGTPVPTKIFPGGSK